MKITIDTKEDSHEEIKKLISLLTSLMEQRAGVQAAEPQPIVGEGIFSMFDTKTEETQQPTMQNTQQNSTTTKTEEEQPRIVLY